LPITIARARAAVLEPFSPSTHIGVRANTHAVR
jgi:hypothetical protein